MADPTQLDRIEAAIIGLTADVASVRSLVQNVLTQEIHMASVLDPLTAAVAQEVTVEQSAITLINGLAAQIQQLLANGATPEQVGALVSQIQASSTALAAAVSANTPAQGQSAKA